LVIHKGYYVYIKPNESEKKMKHKNTGKNLRERYRKNTAAN